MSRDCLVRYGGCRYSGPADRAGKSVWVRPVKEDRVVVTAGGQLVSEHPLEPVLRRTIIDDAHYDALRGRPRYREVKVVPRIETPPLEVERRSLAEYQAIAEAVRSRRASPTPVLGLPDAVGWTSSRCAPNL